MLSVGYHGNHRGASRCRFFAKNSLTGTCIHDFFLCPINYTQCHILGRGTAFAGSSLGRFGHASILSQVRKSKSRNETQCNDEAKSRGRSTIILIMAAQSPDDNPLVSWKAYCRIYGNGMVFTLKLSQKGTSSPSIPQWTSKIQSNS